MDVVFRRIQVASTGKAAADDTALAADRVSIGSSAACTLQLLGRTISPVHAYIDAANGALTIRCTPRNGVTVNGEQQRSAVLNVGDILELGGHRLAILDPPAGFDCAIEIRLNPTVAADEYESSFKTDLSQTWLSARVMTWVALFVILTLSLLVPLYTISRHRQQLPSIVGLPDDSLWSSGPLSQAHAHAAGRKCDACHQQFFTSVQDVACKTCHKDTNAHVSQAHQDLASLGDPKRCGVCHREHVGEMARAVVKEDRLCVECHANADQKFAVLKIKNVSGFELGGKHPDFSVRLKKPPAGTPPTAREVAWLSYKVPLKGAMEQNNLKFSHAEHLDDNRVRGATGNALQCSDCHTLNSSDRYQPITMRTTCASAGCHQLNFDPAAPDRQLPHAQPEEAMAVIEDYFNHKFTDPPPKVPVTRNRPRPDIDPLANLDVEQCVGPAIPCARKRAAAEIENQFNRRGCAGCHEVEDTHDADIHRRFSVIPVRLGSDYFPDLKFSHRTHQSGSAGNEDEVCEFCHSARKSEKSADILLPGIDKCLTCHRDMAGEGTAAQAPVDGAQHPKLPARIVTLQCTSCHEYHPTTLSRITLVMQNNE